MYRLTAGITILYDSKILFGYTTRGYWCMPQGGIDDGETPFEAAKRELFEETCLIDVDWLKESDWFVINFPKSFLKAPRYENFIGQKYKWFLCKPKEKPAVKICKHEYKEYKWLSIDEALEISSGSIKENLYKFVWEQFGLI